MQHPARKTALCAVIKDYVKCILNYLKTSKIAGHVRVDVFMEDVQPVIIEGRKTICEVFSKGWGPNGRFANGI